MSRVNIWKVLLGGLGISALLILMTLTSVEFNFQTFASQNLSKSNSILNSFDNASKINVPQGNSNISSSNSLKTYDNNVISILPLNQNQREIEVGSIILDKLASNSTLGNITSNPSGAPCTTINGIS